MADNTNTNDFAARKEWGDHTVLTIAAPFSNNQGNFEVALIEENGQPVWELTRCNVNDPEGSQAEERHEQERHEQERRKQERHDEERRKQERHDEERSKQERHDEERRERKEHHVEERRKQERHDQEREKKGRD